MFFEDIILSWFDSNKRKLPWRSDREPYHVWLSEIILQQTRVKQGYDYYLKFLKEFPSISDLAHSEEQTVLKAWQGLGYYTRARNLYHTARMITEKYQGKFPENHSELAKLKGIGPYTAAAIASICFDEPVPAIDGNAFRLYSRYFGIDKDISLPSSYKYFFELGEKIISVKRPGDFNQAVMDIGATVCQPFQPICAICPLMNSCEAYAKGIIEKLPVNGKKINIKTRYFHFLEITDDKNILLLKRTGNDVWKNLYTFPLIETYEENSLPYKQINLSLRGLEWKLMYKGKHKLTHQDLHIYFWKTEVSVPVLKKIGENIGALAVYRESFIEYPLPKPIEKYLLRHR